MILRVFLFHRRMKISVLEDLLFKSDDFCAIAGTEYNITIKKHPASKIF